MADLRDDSGSSPSLSNIYTSHFCDDSEGTTSKGTIMIFTTQDDDGKRVNTPII